VTPVTPPGSGPRSPTPRTVRGTSHWPATTCPNSTATGSLFDLG